MTGGKTILLVEDNDNDALLFAVAVRKTCRDTTLITCSTADEAVRYFQGLGRFADRKAFPLPLAVFTDLNLPGMSGEQLIKWIRAQSQFQKLCIAVLTGSADARELSELYSWGADSFLIKTPDLEELATRLRELTAYWLQRGLISVSPC